MKRTSTLLSAMLLILFQISAQFPTELQNTFQDILDKKFTDKKPIGLSVAIHTSDNTWQGVAGISSTGVDLTADSKFGIGSVTKTIIGATIMQMQDEGLLSLEDPLGKYVDSIEHIPGTIPIKHLLNHTSGLFNFTAHPDYGPFVFNNSDTLMTMRATLESFMKPPLSEVNAMFNYCNTNYVVLGMIIETVSGKKYYEDIRSRFDLDNAFPSLAVSPYETKILDLAHLWFDLFGTGKPVDVVKLNLIMNSFFTTAASAGAYSGKPKDIAKWMYLLGRGDLLSDNTWKEMQKIHAPSESYGQGIIQRNISNCGKYIVGHSGYIGYGSSTIYEQKYDIGISIHTNDGTALFLDELVGELLCAYEAFILSTATSSTKINDEITVVPNPIVDDINLTIKLKSQQHVTVQLVNQLGAMVDAYTSPLLSAGEHNWTVKTNLSNGIYFANIFSDGRLRTIKIIKQ